MKAFLSFCIICFLTTVAFGQKQNTPPNLTGKWRLSETFNDPGDGSGKWQAAGKDYRKYITFLSTGKVSGDQDIQFLEDVESWQYKPKFDKRTFVFAVVYKNNKVQKFFYTIKNGVLEISPYSPLICIEGCGIRLIKT